MNDLSSAASAERRRLRPDPISDPFLSHPYFFSLSLSLSVFILVVVRNAFPLVSILPLSSLVFSFIFWNLYKFRTNGSALLFFLDRMPVSDLLTAEDGQVAKIDGVASCWDHSLESYEKIERCIYSSTLLHEYRQFGSKLRSANSLCFSWN